MCDVNENGQAYIQIQETDRIVNSIESDDGIFVFDINEFGDVVGIEILSVDRLCYKYL
jgi:uncharacterized protein YuzE